MQIRPETPSDCSAIRAINVAAFLHHPFSRQTEHLIVEALREAGAMTLSLVAEVGAGEGAELLPEECVLSKSGEPLRAVAGHIAFSQATFDGAFCGFYMAGPLAVMPPLQKRGIGSALVRESLARLRVMGAAGVVLVGDPAYYTRFGFANAPGLTLEGVPPEVILALSFTGSLPKGVLGHHPAFLAGL
jgi:putative acetyltransferase